MLSPTAWNWGPKSGLFWGASAGLSTLYCFLRLPESRGRSYGELDVLFERRVPAWRFEKTRVEQFGGVEGGHGGYGKERGSPVDEKEEVRHVE
jgi:SP family general alpha glucoside:H+ symporter-like MFS transporter